MVDPILKMIEKRFKQVFGDKFTIEVTDFKNSYQILVHSVINTENSKIIRPNKRGYLSHKSIGNEKLLYDIEFTKIKSDILNKINSVLNDSMELVSYKFVDEYGKINTEQFKKLTGGVIFDANFIVRKKQSALKYIKKINDFE